MSALKALMLAIGVVSIAHQESATFISGGARIYLTNANGGTIDGLGQGDKQKHVVVTGNLAQIHSPEKGLTARGRTLEFTWAELDPKTMEFRQGRIEGNATIIIDGEEAQKALADDAQKLNKPLPTPQSESSFMQADSDLFSYAGTVKAGTLTMPNPWTFKQTSKGTKDEEKDRKHVKITYDQAFEASGSKGIINLVPGPDGVLNQLETGTLDGPVHFKIVRHEMTEGTAKPSTSTYIGVADHIGMNLAGHPGTITASGHVIVDADLNGDSCHFEEDTFIFEVNEKLEPLGFQFHGSPGLTKAKAKDGGK